MTSQTRSVEFTVGVAHINRVTLPAEPYWQPPPPAVEEKPKRGEPEWAFKTIDPRPIPQIKRRVRADIFSSWDQDQLAQKLAESQRRARERAVIEPTQQASDRTLRVLRYLARREDTLAGIATCTGIKPRAVEKCIAQARRYALICSERVNSTQPNTAVYRLSVKGQALLGITPATHCNEGTTSA